jgi:Carbohydrate binding domain/PEP-CTERM motif
LKLQISRSIKETHCFCLDSNVNLVFPEFFLSGFATRGVISGVQNLDRVVIRKSRPTKLFPDIVEKMEPIVSQGSALPSHHPTSLGDTRIDRITNQRRRWTMVARIFLGGSIAAILSLVLTAPASAGGNLVVNGDFETGDFTGWTLTGNLGDLYVGNSPNAPHSGSFAAELGEVGSPGFMAQDLATTPGGTYTLSFWLIGTASAGPPNLFSASFGGTTLLDLVNYQSPTTYTEFVYSGLVASSSSTTLQFGFQQNPSYAALDDVSVVQTGTTAIPEPSSLGLAAIAVVSGIGYWGRRRRLATAA